MNMKTFSVSYGVQLRPISLNKVKYVDRKVVRNGVNEFLSEAALNAFVNEQNPDVNWSKISKPLNDGYFAPSFEDVSKLKVLQEAIKATRGCLDPKAINYNPDATEDDGSCLLADSKEHSEDVFQYITTAIQKLFGKNKESVETDKPDFRIQPFTGKVLTQRELRGLTHFQDIVDRAVAQSDKGALT